MSEKIEMAGSSWLLHTTTAVETIGLVAATTSKGHKSGKAIIAVDKDTALIRIVPNERRVMVEIAETIGIQLGALLLRVVAQNQQLRCEHGDGDESLISAALSTAQISFEPERAGVESLGVLRLSTSEGSVLLEDADDQWNLLLAEDVAVAVAMAIFQRLGAVSAQKFWKSK